MIILNKKKNLRLQFKLICNQIDEDFDSSLQYQYFKYYSFYLIAISSYFILLTHNYSTNNLLLFIYFFISNDLNSIVNLIYLLPFVFYFYYIMFTKIILISFFIYLISSIPSDAPYITAKNRPLNIAHRGLASILPQNTLQSFSAALYQGADFIELDVVYTKQKQLLVMHDPFLTRITNIKSLSQFSTRYSTRSYGGVNKTDWWTDEFTLNELKTIGIKQAQAPGRIKIFDYKFTFPTLGEVIELVLAFNKQHKGSRNPDGRLGGILIQAKDSQMYRNLFGLQIGQTILSVLKKYKLDNIQNSTLYCPIYLHSFDYQTVKYWAKNSELPRNYLITLQQPFDLNDVYLYATGIGFNDGLLWNYDNNTITKLFYDTRNLGLLIHIWTFKDDQLLFNSKNNIEMYKIGHNQLKLDGVITQFCDIYAPIAQLLREQGYKIRHLIRQVQI